MMSTIFVTLLLYSIDLKDEFNYFIVNELIDPTSLDDEDSFYFDVINITFGTSLNELIHRGSIVRCVDYEILL
jgi:hypothetical protein